MPHLLFIFGTRPEAIKLCPVILQLRNPSSRFRTTICVTGQHQNLLHEALKVFQVTPDYNLDIMQVNQTLFQSTARIIAALEPVLARESPDMVVVQGDTTTTFAGALSGFYAGIPVAHVEAGLRTGDITEPFPEEMNRVLTTRLAAVHFAPTCKAYEHLQAEGVPMDRIVITGNTGIDAVLYTRDRLQRGDLQAVHHAEFDSSRKLVLVTAHRRESFGEGLENICAALGVIATRSDVQIVFPVHPNPNVRGPVLGRLGGTSGILLCDPLGYVDFIDLMTRAYVIITDSGGIQEEAPALGKPVLVLRDKTERPEAVETGTARLVGCNTQRIVAEVEQLLDDPDEYRRRAYLHNPYGDGRAAARIEVYLRNFFGV
jgi:UDP-N-acetylglucosamine 2-epimerase (non-hydrolysing)